MTLKIPSNQEAMFARFLKISEQDHASLKIALEQAKPSISMDDLASRVSSTGILDLSQTSEIVGLMAGVYGVFDRGDWESLDAFVDELCEAARTSENEDLTGIENWDDAKKRLHDILSLHRSLGLSAKAFDVIREAERLYCRARILTDVRPVFLAHDPSDAEASVILHSLRIAYHVGPTRKVDHFFVMLETDDLVNLKKVIDRALKKDKAVRLLAEKAGVPSLTFEVKED